jgi:hypothetical protein
MGEGDGRWNCTELRIRRTTVPAVQTHGGLPDSAGSDRLASKYPA